MSGQMKNIFVFIVKTQRRNYVERKAWLLNNITM